MDPLTSAPVNADAPIPLMTQPEVAADPAHLPTVPVVAVPVPPPTPEKSSKKNNWGPLIGIVLIVGLIVTAAFYSWGERLATHTPTEVQ